MPDEPPHFTPRIAPHLLHGLDEATRWLYEQLDVQGQQNEFLIRQAAEQIKGQQEINTRLVQGDARFIAIEKTQAEHVKFIGYFRSGRMALIYLLTALVIPILVLVVSERFINPKPAATPARSENDARRNWSQHRQGDTNDNRDGATR
jgi:hypothetical protein